MTELKEIDINYLYGAVLRETENDSIQELNPELYRQISEYVGKLKRQEFDGIETKIKNASVSLITELTSLLLSTRITKAINSENLDFANLLDEEKFILDGEEEKRERTELILSATINGKSKLLESISQKHKTKTLVVRFIKEMDQIVGVDLEKYGPFKVEDIATIPYENAQALISQKIATKLRLED